VFSNLDLAVLGDRGKKVKHHQYARYRRITFILEVLQNLLAVKPAPDDEHGIITIFEETKGAKIATHHHIGLGLNSHLQNTVYVVVQDMPGKPILCDNVPQYAAKLWFCLINGGLISQSSEIVAHSKTLGTPSYHGNLYSVIGTFIRVNMFACGHFVVCHKSFQGVDGHPFIH
jgi:hypothetical protein